MSLRMQLALICLVGITAQALLLGIAVTFGGLDWSSALITFGGLCLIHIGICVLAAGRKVK